MKRWGFVFLGIVALAGCGVIADAVSDAAKTEIDADLFPEMTLGDEYVQPLSISVALNETNNRFSLPATDEANKWGPLIAAHNQLIEDDEDGIFAFDAESFTFTGDDAVYFMVDVFSRDGIVVSEDSVISKGVTVAECDFVLDPAVDGEPEYEQNMTACLTGWVAANGIPYEMGFEVTTGFDALRAAPTTYSMTNTSLMLATNNVEVEEYERQLKIDGDVIDNRDLVVIDNMGIESTARWTRLGEVAGDPTCVPRAGALSVFGIGTVVDTRPGSTEKTYGMLISAMDADRDYKFTVKPVGEGYNISSDWSFVSFAPLMPEWMKKTLEIGINVKAHAGENAEVSAPVRGFYVVSGHCPRVGVVNFKLTGDVRYDTGG